MSPPSLPGVGVVSGPAPEVAGGGLPRAAVIVSIVLHVLGFLFAVGVPRLLSSGPSGNKVYVVDLVSLPGSPAAAPAPPAAAAPAPEPPKKAPVKPPEVKKEPPKKAPVKPVVLPDKNAAKKTTKIPEKPPEKKPPEPEPKPAEPPDKDAAEESGGEEETAAAAPTPPAATPPATAKPGGAAGAAGTGAGAGDGTGSGGGDELDFYLSMLKRRIETAWKRPVSTSRETRSAVVFIELSPTGRLLRLEMKTPSGYAPFDRSIIQAVRDAEPFPPFPLALKMDRLARSIEFQLTPLEGDAPQ